MSIEVLDLHFQSLKPTTLATPAGGPNMPGAIAVLRSVWLPCS